ncbi:trifunctional fatty acid synthase subunit FAS2 [Sporobolomyces koalae]|uniref:trifunctional fatty acid synthase subunit FAS2 n=1 Tax=Sporobolomyces koalae TaxID=500713 RepID=UPI0031823515
MVAAPELPLALSISFAPESSTISMTLFNQPEASKPALPLEFKYKYDPSTPYAPIQEIVEDRNQRIKQHYWDLWQLDASSTQGLSQLKISDEFEGEEVTISEDEIEAFCRVVGHEGEAYKKSYKTGMQFPMDFAIKLGWKSIMKPIFPNSIDGDLLKLVHLSNGFRVLPGAPVLQPGDTVTSTSRIESVTNSDTGKTVSVKGTVFLLSSSAKGKEATSERIPVLEVSSSFFYRGKFTDYAQTFSRVDSPTYSVDIKSPEALAVLQSKEWFQWDDESRPLTVGTDLRFKIDSSYVYADKSSYSSVKVSGAAYIITPEQKLSVKVATIEYTSEGEGVTKGDPVLEYLKRHGTALEQPVMLEGGGYTLTKEGQCTFWTPASNLDYSLTSGDTNPIHTNPYFASLASLPGTITHGMHSSARTRKFVEQIVADNVGARVRKYDVGFTAMCLPNKKMEVKLKHIGMTTGGDRLIKIDTVDLESGAVVLSGTAEVSQAPTAYVFTGQGSQEPGMGMELYNNSPVARAVWDTADAHLGEVYGFSILEIVRTNPKEKTVHFGGLKGQATRQKYMEMTYTTTDKDGNVKTLPLFGDIDLRTSRYTFSSPTGLLYATQFAQIALVVTEKAAFEDMRSKGLVQPSCAFAGHSLGEYSALASIADILPISALVDVVFYRGITMQRAVERDSQNRSSYGMVAVNPSRIGKSFGDAALREVVETIARRGNILIEVVNYNVEGQQYVVAGHLVGLQSLTNVLNFLKVQKIDLAKLTETMSIEQVKEHLCEIVDECVQKAKDLQEKTGFITLERGFATIPLPGIDVPFHSRYLWAGVMPFRTYLSKKVNLSHFNADLLVGRYIPNLTAVPYAVTKEYAERIHTQTSSPRLEKILKSWDEENWGAYENRNKLGYAILIELLSYQFASPVRWIETQDVLFKEFKFERLIELGPSPTLTGMATRTQKLKYDSHDGALGIKRSIYCIAKQLKEIYYQLDDESGGDASAAAAPAAAAAPTPAPRAAPAPVAAAPPPPAAAGPAASVADEPLKAVDTLRIIIAQKLKKPVSEVPLTKTIKELVGGKSTLQNEILGDLQGEFASAPEKGEEMPLAELGAALQAGYSGKLGKYTTGLVSRMIGSKMPGGFGLSAVQAHLAKSFGLGPGRIDGVLLFALTQEPAKRLGNEGEAKAWLDSTAQAYASNAGVALGSGGAAAAAPQMSFAAPAAGGGGAPAAVADEPLKAVDTLRAIIAQKLKKQIPDVPLTKSIKDLVGGKSTLQNEILGDLQGEFSSAPEKGEELPLAELGAALQSGYSGTLGKYTSGLVARMMGAKMPGGFGLSGAKAHLAKTHGLGPGRTDGVLLVALTKEPEKRLASEGEAKAWIDGVASTYASQAGISLGGGGGGGGGAVGGAGMMIDTEALDKMQGKQDDFVSQQVEVFLRYLGRDSRTGHRLADLQKAEVASLQKRLDAIAREHGDDYISGIQPVFTPLKARHFNSSWNWVRQDALMMWMDILFGRLTTVDRDITARCLVIMNRADPALIDYMQYTIDNTPVHLGEKYVLAKQFGQTLLDNCREMIGQAPLYKDVTFPTAPKTTVTAKGEIISEEVQRPGVSRLEKYVAEMAAGSKISVASVNLDKVQDQIEKLYKLVKLQPQISKTHMQSIKSLYAEVVRGLGKDVAPKPQKTAARTRRPSSQFLRPSAVPEPTSLAEDKIPLLHLKRKIGNEWSYSSKLTSLYLDILKEIATSGVTFEHKNALMTGVGKGSIGIEIVKGLLAGGARVVITTSRYSRSTVEYYQAIYQECGSKGSSLTVVPFNQGSKQDVEALVDYIYSKDKGLGMDLDYILPFAALPENGREIDGLDDRSELAHRIMLTNLLRLLGAVKSKKAALQLTTRPTEVVLPLSPNHGLFGNDGLYSESKISLETLFNRWSSESWGEYLCIAGAVIGWTRGTGLMSATNSVAEGIEAQGCRTFSAKEMAFNILGLMHPLVFDVAQIEPVWADLNGGMDKLPDLANLTTDIRTKLNQTAATRRAIAKDNAADYKVAHGPTAEQIHTQVKVAPRANFSLPFPELKPIDAKSELAQLRGLIDLEKVVVMTGYAEVGPFGSSRTRWEMEANGTFSIQGTLELAYITGLIKHFDGRLKDGSLYVGWVDAKTNEPLDDKDVKAAYEKHILAHTGIRMIEPELFGGYDPKRKGFVQEIELQHDLEPIEASEEDANRFKREHEEKVDVYSDDGSKYFVKFKKGAKIQVPKAVAFDRLVAGQIPTGWSHKAFGIPDDIAAQVDRTSLWALVSVAEALMMAGVTDPYELYKYVHPSEVGSSLGSGMGGIVSISKMFRDRREEKDVQKDILQETFINTVAGWVNLLLLSSSGPIKIPVGACATALQSVEIACDTILSGKAKVMIAGGYDDFSEEGSYEFANMKATSNSETEFAAGREPNEMSRPTTSTRAGFMEAQGCGAQVLMSAKTAIEMGATIYGIVAYTATATDKAGRSIPAPGRGVMGTAREVAAKYPSPILNVAYRRRQLEFRRRQISQWLSNETELLKFEVESHGHAEKLPSDFVSERLASIEREAKRQEAEALATYGMLSGSDPSIAPLRRALAVWGLTIDDVGVASFHGTSTVANDKNESNAYNEQFRHLGRAKGNACPVIAQKWLTGHPKGGAAAWMLNGIAQTIQSGLIPGNRNADNISQELRAFEYLLYPSKSIQTDGIKAGLLTSFGFGQVGGQALIIHPEYLLGSLEPSTFESYRELNAVRRKGAYRRFNDFFASGKLVVIKEGAPFDPELETPVLLNPLARTTDNAKTGSFAFAKKLPTSAYPTDKASNAAIASKLVAAATAGVSSVGTDVELISAIPADNETFLERNFTANELAYCRSSPDFKASLAARWAAKEATFKSMKTTSKGAGASLIDIEVVSTETGPTIAVHGAAKAAADAAGITSFEVSLSHSEDVAVAVVISKA